VVPYAKLDKEQGDGIANEAQVLVKAERKKAPQGEKADGKNKYESRPNTYSKGFGF
jgi:hypothetical protein